MTSYILFYIFLPIFTMFYGIIYLNLSRNVFVFDTMFRK